jgi:hypothetical protein
MSGSTMSFMRDLGAGILKTVGGLGVRITDQGMMFDGAGCT